MTDDLVGDALGHAADISPTIRDVAGFYQPLPSENIDLVAYSGQTPWIPDATNEAWLSGPDVAVNPYVHMDDYDMQLSMASPWILVPMQPPTKPYLSAQWWTDPMMTPSEQQSRVSVASTGANTEVHVCVVCKLEVKSHIQLVFHARRTSHATLICRMKPCTFKTYSYANEFYYDHMRTDHPDTHTCDECTQSFRSQVQLNFHASDMGHAAFKCRHTNCGKTFARLDTYDRHQKSHDEDAPRHPCKYCKKYRGLNGFKRKDHLTQHLRGYHHIGEHVINGHEAWGRTLACPHKDCPEYRESQYWEDRTFVWNDRAFTKRADYVSHMRKIHDESEFSCPEFGCDRVGKKGYFRRADLRTHLKKVHGTDGSFAGDEE
ncbi:hypothetical protein BDV95DRAFT_586467 [Massariosphaeria phaeospora]|uniref:C2H2-type domain-containing protein n=1 Tax=Massariosphaeria phaeospora TaxID=100035 RepID=A0A7C8MEY1_9PLEO|nr:hypothetical protein BDV95DRAFT_586467 [Massariosphaeria phaeospora]